MFVEFVSFLFDLALSTFIIIDEILTSDFPDFNSEVKPIMVFDISSSGAF